MAQTNGLGRTTALYGISGSGKTTQAGQYAKWIKKTTGKDTLYVGADLGGNDSIGSLLRLGVVQPTYFGPDDNPWVWIDHAVSTPPESNIGLIIYDSGTSMGEALLSSAAQLGAKGLQVGSQKPLKFAVPGTSLTVGSNTESHYMVVQSFLLDAIWKSTWLARRGVDILWTFGEHRADSASEASGPKVAGKALTGPLPKWLRFTLRIAPDLMGGNPDERVLYLTPHSDGMANFPANARYPLEATTPLPVEIRPANIIEFWELSARAQEEADAVTRDELGL